MRGPVRYADSDGLQVAYQIVGDGPVDLVLVPGLMNHIEAVWDVPEMTRVVEWLASFSRVVLLDKRGSGLSDRLPEDERATLEERVHDVTSVLDVAGARHPYLIATADGTPVALMAAAVHPDRFSGLVLWEASACLAWHPDYPIGIPRELLERVPDAIRANWGSEDDPGLWALASSMVEDARWRAAIARMQRRACTPVEAARYWKLNQEIDARSVLGSIRVPTLVLHTVGDAVYPITHGRYVAEHIAGARFVELSGTDHFCYAESGDRVVAEIEEFVTGAHTWPAADRRLASILFTDVVDSTRHLAEVGDGRWRALLDAHDQLIDVEVERHRGRVVARTGDGCVALFDGPREALLCGRAILTGAEQLGLELRAGTHTGEIELRGDDIAGMAVHLAARVSACAGPGELLATRTVRDLVAGSTFFFVDVGERELKGIPERWELYRLAPW